jgi:hypothetical protein
MGILCKKSLIRYLSAIINRSLYIHRQTISIMKTKLIAVIALSAILSVAVIVASIGQSAMAINQNKNGGSANSPRGGDANGLHGASGGHGGDAVPAGSGQNGGSNCIGPGCPP